MLVLYCCLQYDYNNPAQGYSFEHYNFYDTLVHMGHEVIYFDFGTLYRELGKDGMNRRLLEVVKSEKPRLAFFCLFGDEFYPQTLQEISFHTDTTTVNWFADDHWRFEKFSRHWAPCFNWVVTTAQSALPKYKRLGYKNVIKSQWACNHFLYRKQDVPLDYDMTFIGQPHGNRREVIQALRDAGIDVRAWGTGWESGRLDQAEMIRVFNASRINLNLSNPVNVPRRRRFMVWKNWSRPRDQIKGRNFEVPGCGGFLLTGRAENLDEYYSSDREIGVFNSTKELVDKARYFLAHEAERAHIAQAGYERTLREHTYEKRFQEIFARMGLNPL